nr:hypothetical protein [Streptomyces qinzhouensis]
MSDEARVDQRDPLGRGDGGEQRGGRGGVSGVSGVGCDPDVEAQGPQIAIE